MTSHVTHLRSITREMDRQDHANRLSHPVTVANMEAVDGVILALHRAPYSPRRDELMSLCSAWALACEYALRGPNEVSVETQENIRKTAVEVAAMTGEDQVPASWRAFVRG